MNNYYPFAQQCVPGDIVDWKGVMEALKEIGYAGYVELVTYPWFSPDFHRDAFAWATNLVAEVGV
jgi:sugar phosphate isomerase/epimerase